MFGSEVIILEDLSYTVWDAPWLCTSVGIFIVGVVFIMVSIFMFAKSMNYQMKCTRTMRMLKKVDFLREENRSTEEQKVEKLNLLISRVNELHSWCTDDGMRVWLCISGFVGGGLVIGLLLIILSFTHDFISNNPSEIIIHKYRVEISGGMPAEIIESFEIEERCEDGTYIIREL